MVRSVRGSWRQGGAVSKYYSERVVDIGALRLMVKNIKNAFRRAEKEGRGDPVVSEMPRVLETMAEKVIAHLERETRRADLLEEKIARALATSDGKDAATILQGDGQGILIQARQLPDKWRKVDANGERNMPCNLTDHEWDIQEGLDKAADDLERVLDGVAAPSGALRA